MYKLIMQIHKIYFEVWFIVQFYSKVTQIKLWWLWRSKFSKVGTLNSSNSCNEQRWFNDEFLLRDREPVYDGKIKLKSKTLF